MALAIQSPPSSNALHSELRCLVRYPDIDHRTVQGDVVSSVWDGLALAQVRKIVNVHFLRLALRQPSAPPVLKGSHEFLFLRVHRNHRVTKPAECFDLSVEITELSVPIGMLRSPPHLYMGLQSVTHIFQTPAYRHTANGVSGNGQFLGYGPCGLAGPFQGAHGIASRRLLHDVLQKPR